MTREQLWTLSLFILFVSLGALGLKVWILVQMAQARSAARGMPVHSAERYVADAEFVDALMRLIQVALMAGMGVIFSLAMMFGSLRLDDSGGYVLASIWVLMTVLPVVIGLHRLISLKLIREALRTSSPDVATVVD